MKKLILSLVTLSILFASCSTDFKVGADYKEITTIYCLLSKSDTAQYVKITKGFYDEKMDNLVLAQNPDTLYFNNLDVKMEELNNGNITNVYPLTRVNLNLEGYTKEPGVFVDSPNYAYKLKQTLNPQRLYRLRVKNITSGKEIIGETSIIDDTPNSFSITNPFTAFDKLNFSDPTKNYTFAWNGPSNAAFYDVVIRFHYEEYNTNTLLSTQLYKDVPVVKNVTKAGAVAVQMENKAFYNALVSALGAPSSNIVRRVDTPDLLILAGGQVLKTYVDVNSAQGGITFDQIKPIYTNFVGDDVMGIISTRVTKKMIEIPYTESTFDSIINGQYTKNLKFVSKSLN